MHSIPHQLKQIYKINNIPSPTPDNGGSDCLGNDTGYDTCMDEECTGWYKDIDIPMLFLFSKLTY
jgi:hypothetical protein